MSESLLQPSLPRRVGGQAAFVLFGNTFTLIVGLPLQIYIARTLGAAGLGIFALLDALIGMLANYLSFGVPQAVVRFMPELIDRQEYANIRKLLRLAAAVVAVSGVAGCVILVAGLRVVEMFWPQLGDSEAAILLMTPMIPLSIAITLLQQALRGVHEIRSMTIGTSVIQLTVKAVLIVVLFAAGLELDGLILAVVLSSLCSAIWMAIALYRIVGAMPVALTKGEPARVAEWRRYAVTVYVQGLLLIVTSRLDRFLLGYFIGPNAVGIYSVVDQLQRLPLVFHQMLLIVVAPMLASAHARGVSGERERLYHLMIDWVFRLSFPLIIFLMFFAEPALSLFGPKFTENDAIVALIVLVSSQLVNLSFGPIAYVLLMSGLERRSLQISFIQVLGSAVLTILLVPAFGLIGAAVCSLIGTVFVNAASFVMARRNFALQWWDVRYRAWLLPCILTCVFAIVFRGYGHIDSPISLGIVLTVMYGVFSAASFLQGLHADDKEMLRHFHDLVWSKRGRLP